MINHGRIRSMKHPEETEFTSDSVYVASNITKVVTEIDENHTIEEYEYDYMQYAKDEYIHEMTDNVNMLLGCVLEMSEIVYQ